MFYHLKEENLPWVKEFEGWIGKYVEIFDKKYGKLNRGIQSWNAIDKRV